MVRLFLTTANVGSVFENIDKGLSLWFNEFTSVIREKDPQFVAIHFQETGGKNYQNGSDVIDKFFRELVERMEKLDFRRAEGFVDSRSDLEDQFTALASVYFVHETLHNVQIWDFEECCFMDISTTAKLYTGSELELTRRKQKEKFPQEFFPNCKWSRKGFLRTKWRIEGATLDFVNIHLFHDSCNLIAASAYPSPFAQNRQKTMQFVLNKLGPLNESPMYIFGDFNFRINSYEVLDRLRTETLQSSRLEAELLILESKRFECPDHELRFKEDYHWLKPYDFEAKQLSDRLEEEELTFHPSYPFEEDESRADNFLRTRCPAWCDRVLFSFKANDIMSQEFPREYNIIGSGACMGDHKPVYLSFTLACHGSSKEDGNQSIKNPIDEPSEHSGRNRNYSVDSSNISSSKCRCNFVSFLREISFSNSGSNNKHKSNLGGSVGGGSSISTDNLQLHDNVNKLVNNKNMCAKYPSCRCRWKCKNIISGEDSNSSSKNLLNYANCQENSNEMMRNPLILLSDQSDLKENERKSLAVEENSKNLALAQIPQLITGNSKENLKDIVGNSNKRQKYTRNKILHGNNSDDGQLCVRCNIL